MRIGNAEEELLELWQSCPFLSNPTIQKLCAFIKAAKRGQSSWTVFLQ
jgi:hypothetical protein